MKYLPTPLNIAAAIMITIAVYNYITAPKGGDGLQNFWVLPMIGTAILALVIDYFLQRYIDGYVKLAIIEVLVLALFFALPKLILQSEKESTFLVSNTFDRPYVAVIYDVPDGLPLLGKWGKAVEITVPENGILRTSTKYKSDLPSAQIVTNTPHGYSPKGTYQFGGKLDCSGTSFNYSVWYIEEFEYDTALMDAIKSEVAAEMQRQCESL